MVLWEEERHRQIAKQVLKICFEQDMTYNDVQIISSSLRREVEQHRKDSTKEKIKVLA